MSKVQPSLMKSATFRRRMRGVKAQADWRAVMAQRTREVAAADRWPLGACDGALELGQRALDVRTDALELGIIKRAKRRLSQAIKPQQGIILPVSNEGRDAHEHAVVSLASAVFLPQRLRDGAQPVVKIADLAVLKFQASLNALFKFGHRLLSVRLRCGEEAESSAEANPPPTTKRSGDQ